MRIIKSESINPSVNLSFEEYLIEQKQDVIYFWQNEPTIVIGRNQNPYTECNLKKIREDAVNLMRRRSGGGTVYHDYGNINFTIISKKEEGVIERNFNLIIKALKTFGIDAYVNGRNDLEVDGKKISGSAFYEEDDIYCHHGTLLINSDLSKLSEYLTVNKLKLESKGIKSVRSRVGNLIDFNKDITIDKFIDAVCKIVDLKLELITKDELANNAILNHKISKYVSWNWTYGESMEFNVKLEDKLKFGLMEIDFFIANGKVEKCNIFTDSLVLEDFPKLRDTFIGKLFEKSELTHVVNTVITNKEIAKEINKLFNNI